MNAATHEIIPFESLEFGTLRTVQLNGEPWFVAADVCRVLEIQNTTDAIQKLDDDERSRFNLGLSGGDTNIINEPGLYVLVLGSRKKQARAFRRWITHEVIPAIRRNGYYIPPERSITGYLTAREQIRAVNDVSNLIRLINHVMEAQLSPPRKVARTVESICKHYGIPIPEDFVKPEPPQPKQRTNEECREMRLEYLRRNIIEAELRRQEEDTVVREAHKEAARLRAEYDQKVAKERAACSM